MKAGIYYENIVKPIFHNFILSLYEMKDPVAINEQRTKFRELNEKIAENIVKIKNTQLKNLKMVWLHDIHLIYVPFALRKVWQEVNMGMYIHAAFPSSEIFRALT